MYNVNKIKVLIKIDTIVIKVQSRDYFHMRRMLNGAGAKLSLNRMVGISNCRASRRALQERKQQGRSQGDGNKGHAGEKVSSCYTWTRKHTGRKQRTVQKNWLELDHRDSQMPC